MPETESKTRAAKATTRDEAAKRVADAAQATSDAFEAQHAEKVARQNARFAELGESLRVDTALGELGVKVNK